MLNILMVATFFIVGAVLCAYCTQIMKAVYIAWCTIYGGAALAGLFCMKLFSSGRIELMDAIGCLILVLMAVNIQYAAKKKNARIQPPIKTWRGALFFVVALVFVAALFYGNRFSVIDPAGSVIIH